MTVESPAALKGLLQEASLDDHEKILEISTSVLHSFPQNDAVRRMNVVALLKLDRFEKALEVVSDGGVEFQKECVFEAAYAYYKIGNFTRARKCLQPALKSPGRNVLHLDAQIAYRSESFGEVGEGYASLSLGSTSHGENHDLSINKLAVAAQLHHCGREASSHVRDDSDDQETFEIAYNTACVYATGGLYKEALESASLSKQLCESSEELSDEERQEELVPIQVQLGYIFSRLGLADEAMGAFSAVNSPPDSDPDSTFVLKLNMALSACYGLNPHLTERTFRHLAAINSHTGLFGYQKSLLNLCEMTLKLHCGKTTGVVRRITDMLEPLEVISVSSYTGRLSALRAAAMLHLRRNVSSTSACQDLLERQPSDLGSLLTMVELYLRKQRLGAAAKAIEKYAALLGRKFYLIPGLVALLVALYTAQGRRKTMTAFLSKFTTSCVDDYKDASISLLRGIGLSLITSHQKAQSQLASSVFRAMFERNPSDDIAQAGLLASDMRVDANESAHHSSQLPAIPSLLMDTRVDLLLSRGVVIPSTSVGVSGRTTDDAETPTRRRRRKFTGPTEGGKHLDPERWLPLRDRSSFRPKGKKGKKRTAEATQGGISKEETIELVGGAGAVKVEKAAPTAPKKKKKGRK